MSSYVCTYVQSFEAHDKVIDCQYYLLELLNNL